MLFGSDRNTLRQVFFCAWHKHQTAQPLDDAERLVVVVARQHPEYHDLLAQPEAGNTLEARPELGQSNPFLHMSLHIAIEEQIAADLPPGIRHQYTRLCRGAGDEHVAQHWMMECLGEVLWHASRAERAPDMQAYLDCLARSGPAGKSLHSA